MRPALRLSGNLALFCLVITFLFSCATRPPIAVKPPETLAGLYLGRDGPEGNGVVIEIRFFPSRLSTSGAAHIRTYWEEDTIGYSEVGEFVYTPGPGLLILRLSPESTIGGFSAAVGGSPPGFQAGGIGFVFQADPGRWETKIEVADIAGSWLMSYRYEGEPVEVILELDRTGNFTEITRYHGGDADLKEEGRFELSGGEGLVRFYYNSRPSEGHVGLYDRLEESIYTRDGDFRRN